MGSENQNGTIFNDVDSSSIVVIKDANVGDYLYIIAKKGTFRDDVKLQVVSKRQRIAEEIVYLLSKSYGWREVDRTRQRVVSKAGYEIIVWIIEMEKIGPLKGL